jgi:hypothetical protein
MEDSSKVFEGEVVVASTSSGGEIHNSGAQCSHRLIRRKMQATKKCCLRSHGRGKNATIHQKEKRVARNYHQDTSSLVKSTTGAPLAACTVVQTRYSRPKSRRRGIKEGVKIKLGTHPFRAPCSKLQGRILSLSLAFQDPGLPVAGSQ